MPVCKGLIVYGLKYQMPTKMFGFDTAIDRFRVTWNTLSAVGYNDYNDESPA